jgi:hypothetical protein
MNATTVGKALIFVNLVMSVVFASWAAGIYTNRIDWPGGGTPTVPGEKALGEVGKRKAEIAESEAAAKLALGSWQTRTATINQLEQAERPRDRTWYATKLKSLQEGAGAVTALAYGTDGKLQVGADGPAIPGLKSRAGLRQDITAIDSQIQQQTAAANKDLKEADELTVQINGIREGNLVKQKGLRDLLAEEEQARLHALAETEYVRPFRFNRQAEAEILQKRQASLGQRIEELKKVSTAHRQP